jgi:hypothetical protein
MALAAEGEYGGLGREGFTQVGSGVGRSAATGVGLSWESVQESGLSCSERERDEDAEAVVEEEQRRVAVGRGLSLRWLRLLRGGERKRKAEAEAAVGGGHHTSSLAIVVLGHGVCNRSRGRAPPDEEGAPPRGPTSICASVRLDLCFGGGAEGAAGGHLLPKFLVLDGEKSLLGGLHLQLVRWSSGGSLSSSTSLYAAEGYGQCVGGGGRRTRRCWGGRPRRSAGAGSRRR